jgi:predicted small lipoprotein YifL
MTPPAPRVWIAAIGALLVCGGCGFKGPLYLPERNATVVTHPAKNKGKTSPQSQSSPSSQPAQPSQPPGSPPAAAPPSEPASPPPAQ